jgi:hypothetical protein
MGELNVSAGFKNSYFPLLLNTYRQNHAGY